MAEAAGLALGAIGIIGIVGALKDTIDLLNLVADSRQLGREYGVLDAKFDIEKTRLLQWAEGVGLTETYPDARLHQNKTQEMVTRILCCIKSLMEDASCLKQRYGLDEHNGEKPSGAIQRLHRISDNRMAAFTEAFRTFQLRNDTTQQNATRKGKVRWVIQDKQKFEVLIQEIAHFNAKLYEIVPIDKNEVTVLRMIAQDIQSLGDLKELKVLLKASLTSHGKINEFTQSRIEEELKSRILAKLWFRRMDERMGSVKKAHLQTLRWSLDANAREGTLFWDDIPEWLSTGSGIYWISGKAGSGKSTLMKYLYSHERIPGMLRNWAQSDDFVMASFFFTHLGLPEQKSQEGLLRALLYQILHWRRSIIQSALPYMWKELYDSKNGECSNPSLAELEHAFEIVANETRSLGKICLFVDGLDEFEGDYTVLIEFMVKLASYEHIKIMVSSRPVPECAAAFEASPKMRLQDLTLGDITKYVEDVVGSHQYLQRLMRRHPKEASSIIRDVIAKSSGVFLWVILACRSLLDGFADYDRISELRRRVDDLPPELEDMFKHMLRRIKKHHLEQGARLLRICYDDQNQSSFSYPIYGDNGIYALGLGLVENYHETPVVIEPLDLEAKQGICEELEGRLRSRCGGLLELRNDSSNEYCFCGSWCRSYNKHIDARVEFMHRTVFEFLSNEDVWHIDCLKLPDPDRFHIPTALSQHNLQLAMQSLCVKRPVEKQVCHFFRKAIDWGVAADQERPVCSESIFRHLQPFLDSLPKLGPDNTISINMIPSTDFHNMEPMYSHASLLVAIESGAKNFVKDHPWLRALAKHNRIRCGCVPLLYHAVRGLETWNCRIDTSIEMVQLMLRVGCDPNEHFGGDHMQTPWIAWLKIFRKRNTVDHELAIMCTMELFLDYGADPKPAKQSLVGWLRTVTDLPSVETRVREKAIQLTERILRLRDEEGASSSSERPKPSTHSAYFDIYDFDHAEIGEHNQHNDDLEQRERQFDFAEAEYESVADISETSCSERSYVSSKQYSRPSKRKRVAYKTKRGGVKRPRLNRESGTTDILKTD
ncbi:prion-inhibition and propagation-domain-containing protein [Hypoxylon rubiginosum]|uniref:Prion-inhibition and propagation-domain-containing protein n=1 Tax=Hypoxylon rubiginosum TaxID=110542 RepID=A0ACC0CYJ7_9PEZI|nr:prion-inhibition and propagation-domain-containing protein [Hypoxylon rubiginosum]